MLNTTLEANHEDMFECHFKHELLQSQLVKKKREIASAEALSNMLRLVLACEDPNYKIELATSPSSNNRGSQGFGRGIDFQPPNN